MSATIHKFPIRRTDSDHAIDKVADGIDDFCVEMMERPREAQAAYLRLVAERDAINEIIANMCTQAQAHWDELGARLMSNEIHGGY